MRSFGVSARQKTGNHEESLCFLVDWRGDRLRRGM
jgi:hypothetical protein